jgi:geranylgeranylglycerol-phosphate geranylgeranyltransferase
MSHINYIIKLIVPEYIPMGVLALLVGLFFSTQKIILNINLIYAIIASILLISGYNSFNAVIDKDIDKINKPDRPLPQGKLTTNQAIYLATLFFVLSLLLGYIINYEFFVIMLAGAILSILYSLPAVNLKKRFLIGTITANSIYTIIMPTAGWAVNIYSNVPIYLIIFLFLFGLGSAILKDFEDIVGDTKHHVRTILSKGGYSNTLFIASMLMVISIVVLLLFISLHLIPSKYVVISIFIIPALINIYILFNNRHISEYKKAFMREIITIIMMQLVLIAVSLI